MATATSQVGEPNWRTRKPPLHWRIAIPIGDVAEVLDLSSDTIESLVARDELPARLTDGWLLISYGTLFDPDRSSVIAKLQHAWSQTFEWEADMASDRFPNRPTRQPDGDCSCDGCLTHHSSPGPRS